MSDPIYNLSVIDSKYVKLKVYFAYCRSSFLKRLLLRSTRRSLSTAVTSLMKSCITHQLASQYTLFGKSKTKKNFSSHRLYKVIIQVVLRAFPTTNQDDINEHVGSYMRHAPSKPGCPKHKKSTVSTTRCELISGDTDDDDR